MLKKFLLTVLTAGFLQGLPSSGQSPEVIWELQGNYVDRNERPVYRERFTVKNLPGPFSRLAFCAMKHVMAPLNPLDTVVELLPGYYAVGSPRFAETAPGDSVVLDFVSSGWFHNSFNAPDGMHLVADGKTIRTVNRICPVTSERSQWVNPLTGEDLMVYGPEAYVVNDSLRSSVHPAPYMQIPTPKSVRLKGGHIPRPVVAVRKIEDPRIDYYRVELSGDTATLYTNCVNPRPVLDMLERRMTESADEQGMVPVAEIEDWADFGYRGLMIDVARNFIQKEEIKEIIALMARYGLNVLHFHVGDDEGWRVEIPGLPELTEVGSRRGYTETDDVPFLKQIYSGDGNPDATDTPANGFYTVEDYIDLIRYADALGVAVIPEFDSPGHSRAAIRAMEHRALTTGDPSLRLIHDDDRSEYSTAQFFHDNLMNPALEGPYLFWGKVMDGIKDIYQRAGVPLPAIHIGGDEVPEHAWDGSDIAVAFMKEKGMTHQRELHAWFVARLARLAAERGIRIAGWQEIALDHSTEYDATVQPVVMAVNSWTNAGDFGSRMARAGYPVILSNVDYLYFDQTPTSHPEEPGLTWGGLVDEFRPLHATVETLCPGDAAMQESVAGISGHLFAETVRNPGMVQRYILPKLLGLAERAHNSSATLTDAEYFGYLTSEMKRWEAEGLQFYLRQPGIIREEDCVLMNEPYGFGEIRYTLDGSEPTPGSPLYTGPFAVGDDVQVRARLYAGPSRSVTSILLPEND